MAILPEKCNFWDARKLAMIQLKLHVEIYFQQFEFFKTDQRLLQPNCNFFYRCAFGQRLVSLAISTYFILGWPGIS